MPSLFTRFGEEIPHFGQKPGVTVNQFTGGAGAGNESYGNIANWSLGHVPVAGEIAHYLPDKLVVIDAEYLADVYCHWNDGAYVYFWGGADTALQGKHFLQTSGTWQMGHVDDRIGLGKTCRLRFSAIALENTSLSDYDPKTYGNGFIGFGGTVTACAQNKRPIGELATDALAGNAYCVMTVNPQTTLGWRIGDELYFPTTAREDFLSFHPITFEPTWVMKLEYRTITGFNAGNKVLLSAALTYDHRSMNFDDTGWPTRRTQILNLTQPIRFESVDHNVVRGHTLILDGCTSTLRHVQFLDMGRTLAATIDNTDATHIGTNQIGRYPLHWHKPYPVQLAEDCVFSARGTLTASGVKQTDPRRWGFACHDAHYSTVRRCVSHGFNGAGFAFAEEGNEYEDLFEDCVASRHSGTGDRDELTFAQENHGNGGFGFWGHSIKVRLRNNAAYDVWGPSYSAALYLNNNAGNNTRGGLDYSIPTAAGLDRLLPGNSTTFNHKKSGILEIDGFLSVACRSGPVIWHIGTHSQGGIGDGDPPVPPPTWQYPETPPSAVKNLFFYNCMETGYLQYEMVDCTFDGFFARCDDAVGLYDAVWYWGDYVQIQSKMKNVRLQGAAVIKTPSVMAARIGVEADGSFKVENLKAKTNSPPLLVRPWSDIGPGGGGGSYMYGRTGDITFTNCDRVNAGPVYNLPYGGRGWLITQVGSEPDSNVDTITSGAPIDQQAFNAIARQRVYITDHRGTGQNFRAWHDGQHPNEMAPYSIVRPGAYLGTGVAVVVGAAQDKTNQQALTDLGLCAFGELMAAGAAAHADFEGGSVIQTTQIVDNGGAGYSSTGFEPFAGQGYGGSVEYAQNSPPAVTAEATWTFTSVTSGAPYKVAVTYTEDPNRATDAPFEIRDATTQLWTGTINQQLAPNDFTAGGVGWKYLNSGNPVTPGNGTLVVKLRNAPANGYVLADAVRIERVL